MPDKREHYEYLFGRLTEAIKADFYLEAAWLAHAVIEDRINSALRESSTHRTGKLFGNIKNLKKAKSTDSNLRGAFFDDLLERIDIWRKKRNKLTHALADEVKPISDLMDEYQELATTGEKLAREVASAVMRLKKRKAKSGT